MSEALHLHCVVARGEDLASVPVGLDGAEVAMVCHHDLAAVVSPAPTGAYTALPREDLLRHLFAHERLLEKVLETRTPVPVKFGTTCPDAGEVRRILAAGYRQFVAALKSLDATIELDVVALWKSLPDVLRQIGSQGNLRALKERIATTNPGPTLEDRLLVGRAVKARLDEWRGGLAVECVGALEGLTRAHRWHPIPDDRMVMNVAFLLSSSNEDEFGARLEHLSRQYEDELDFRCVGPLPAHSFCIAEVTRLGPAEVAGARTVLGVGDGAPLAEIRKAYRRLARQLHPDTKPSSEHGRMRFERLTAAYRLLTEHAQGKDDFVIRMLPRPNQEARVA